MNKPHKHAELIKAWADGAEIEIRYGEEEWKTILDPFWCEDSEYRIKKNIVKTVGYRRYVLNDGGKHYTYIIQENSFSAVWEEQTKNGFGAVTFVKWLDTEWQYDEVEV